MFGSKRNHATGQSVSLYILVARVDKARQGDPGRNRNRATGTSGLRPLAASSQLMIILAVLAALWILNPSNESDIVCYNTSYIFSTEIQLKLSTLSIFACRGHLMIASKGIKKKCLLLLQPRIELGPYTN